MSLYDTGIRPLVDEYLRKKGEEQRDYGDYWSASSAGYCMRKNIFDRLGVPKVPELADSATQTRIFEAGHIFHEWLQRITKDAGLSIASEVELQDEELMIRGHFDDLVLVGGEITVSASDVPMTPDNPSQLRKMEIDKRLILYDYKTAHSASFNYKKQRSEIGHYHRMQLGTYMYMLRNNVTVEPVAHKLKGLSIGDLTESRILSISKDDLRMHEDQLLWTPELEKDVVGYWTELNDWWARRKIPPCTCLEHDGGFMGRRSKKGKIYNPYFYEDEPCSLKWLAKFKKEKDSGSQQDKDTK